VLAGAKPGQSRGAAALDGANALAAQEETDVGTSGTVTQAP
jgi:hypothetical protein